MARSSFAGRATLVVVAVAAVAAIAALPAVAQGQASLPRHGHRAGGADRQPFALSAGKPIHVGHNPCAIAITPNGHRLRRQLR